MNVRASPHELGRVRKDIGAALRRRERDDGAQPVPESLLVLLKELATRVRDTERERLFAEVDGRIAELLLAVGRSSSGTCREPAGRTRASL